MLKIISNSQTDKQIDWRDYGTTFFSQFDKLINFPTVKCLAFVTPIAMKTLYKDEEKTKIFLSMYEELWNKNNFKITGYNLAEPDEKDADHLAYFVKYLADNHLIYGY
jgi:hypothetical protein